jgi:predicted RNA binding protein YcfA (HicA-like mRNA interferase family)
MICIDGSYDPSKIWREVLELHRNETLTSHTIAKIAEEAEAKL